MVSDWNIFVWKFFKIAAQIFLFVVADFTLQNMHSPPFLLRLHTRITVHAQRADQQKSNGKFEARMSQKCSEWRHRFIMTLSQIHWVPVQDKGSKIPCVMIGAMKIIQSDRLHHEYLTNNLGNTSD